MILFNSLDIYLAKYSNPKRRNENELKTRRA